MSLERRAAPREPLKLWLLLGDGSLAVTRDISTSGLFLYMDSESDLVPCLTLELVLSAARLTAAIDAEVVRLEPGPDRTGVALLFQQARLQAPGSHPAG